MPFLKKRPETELSDYNAKGQYSQNLFPPGNNNNRRHSRGSS